LNIKFNNILSGVWISYHKLIIHVYSNLAKFVSQRSIDDNCKIDSQCERRTQSSPDYFGQVS